MLKEQALEKKIVDALGTALTGLADYKIMGFWQPTAAGELKGLEEVTPKALVQVKMAQARQPVASVVTVEIPAAVVLTVRLELDPQGEDFVDYVEKIRDLFQNWMSLTYQQEFTALDTSAISIDGLTVEGGEPVLDVKAKIVKVSWALGLSGSYKEHAETEQE